MNIDDFSFIICENCKNIIIVPIPYEYNRSILTDMCNIYDEMSECCKKSFFTYGGVSYGIEDGCIKVSDLPLALRKKFPPEVTHEFACGKHSLVVTKHNGDKVTVSVNSNNVMITDTYATTIVYVMDD